MVEYYGYVERNVDSQINWAEVGKGVVNMLREEDRIRTEKKAAIDEASRQFGETLANAPVGQFKTGNEWILNYADDASQARLMQDRLLKSGMLKLKDYTIMRQNLNDGTNQMFQVAREIQNIAAEKIERYNLGESQETEAWLMEQVQGLSNLQQTKAYINPTNFTVSLGKMKQVEKDGKTVMVMDEDPNNFASINQLRNRLDTKFNRYKYLPAIDTQVNALGEDVTSEIKALSDSFGYSVTQIADITQRKDIEAAIGKERSDEAQKKLAPYFQWENNTIASELSNPLNALSILTDAQDVVPGTNDFYTPTFNPEDVKKGKQFILLEDDGSGIIRPKFTKEQKKVAEDFMRTQIRMSLDKKVVSTVTARPAAPAPSYAPEYVYRAGESQKKETDAINLLGQLYYGDSEQVQSALTYFRDTVPNAKNVTRDNNGVTVTFNDGTKRTYPFVSNGTRVSQETFIKQAAPGLANITDVNTAMQRSSYNKGASFSSLSSQLKSEVSGGGAAQTKPIDVIKSHFGSSKYTKGAEQNKAVQDLSPLVTPLGFDIKATGVVRDFIKITSNKDPNITKEFKTSETTKDDIINWIAANTSLEKIQEEKAKGTLKGELNQL